MQSLFHDEQPVKARAMRTAAFSVALHALVVMLIAVGAAHVRRVVVFQPKISGSGVAVSMVSLSSSALASALSAKTPAAKAPAPVKTKLLPARKPITPALIHNPVVQTAAPAQPSATQTASMNNNSGVTGAGSDAQSMYPAYPLVSPSPQVKDRSLLPAADAKVVVDVNLGPGGEVQQIKLVSGLGNALDQVVLDTVHDWRFHPAMLNGGPVASSIELVFPFNRNYPIAE